jgi:hypothetical protein
VDGISRWASAVEVRNNVAVNEISTVLIDMQHSDG